ncbi:hypothetical protein SUDANB95_07954 (plasmid) [Actinosynnema sp. ALI-1.44]
MTAFATAPPQRNGAHVPLADLPAFELDDAVTRALTSGAQLPEDILRLHHERVAAHLRKVIHDDPIHHEVLEDEEFDNDVAVTQAIRAASRESRRRLGLEQVKAEENLARAKQKADVAHQHADFRMDKEDLADRLWERKALRKRRKLTDPVAKLASALIRYRVITGVLGVMMLAGITWTSYGVAHALGGDDPAAILYIVEWLFSIPLLVIVAMQITASEYARLEEMRSWDVITLEVLVLGATIVVNTAPAFTAPVFSVELFVSRFAPPILIVIMVYLQSKAAALFGGILRDAQLEVDLQTRLSEDGTRAVSLAVDVLDAMAAGTLKPADGEKLPSISKIMARFSIGKKIAQGTHDLLSAISKHLRV